MMKWYRTITGQGFWSTVQITDAELLAIWNIPPLAVRLGKMRLLYAFQWYNESSTALLSFTTAEDFDNRSWLTAVRHAISWLQSMCETERAPPITTEETVQWIHDHRTFGAKQVRHAVARYIVQQHLIFDVYRGHRRIHQLLATHGAQFPSPPESSDTGIYPCSLCEKCFNNAQALQGHLWSWRHQCSDERRYVYSDTCLACGTCYWTAQRVQQHLKASRNDPNGCLAHLIEYYDPLDEPATVDKPVELQRYHRLPNCPTYGPHTRPLEPAWRRLQRQRLDHYDEQWAALQFPNSVDEEVMSRFGMALTRVTQSWYSHRPGDVRELEIAWHDIFVQHPNEKEATLAMLHWGKHKMYDILGTWIDPDAITIVEQAFHDIAEAFPIWPVWNNREAVLNWQPPVRPALHAHDTEVKHAAVRGQKEVIADHFRDQQKLISQFDQDWAKERIASRGVPILVAEDGTRYLVIMHMFSGRRREHDCTYWAQTLKDHYFKSDNLEVMMLSIDTAIDINLGNLDDGATFDAIFSLALHGCVALGLSGPPCETWSAARHLELPDQRRGPRPLRSCSNLWGVPFRTMRELLQVWTGNRLMLNALLLECCIAIFGGISMMEHPEEPRNGDFASIWRTGLHHNLFPGTLQMAAHHLQQWKFGAVAVKPTRIRVLGMPQCYAGFRRNEVPGLERPTSHLGGVDHTTGNFRTAAAKEYPADFCKALVDVAFDNLARRLRQEGPRLVQMSTLDPRAKTWMYSMTETGKKVCTDAQWLPDYQPR